MVKLMISSGNKCFYVFVERRSGWWWVVEEEEEWGRRRKMKKGHIPSYLIIRLQIISQRHDHTSGPSKQPAVVSNLRNSSKQKASFFSAFINVQVFERFFELNQQI